MKQQINVNDLGLIDYQQAWDYQEQLLQENVRIKLEASRSTDKAQLTTANHLLFCEHPPVYTLGKSGHIENLLINREAAIAAWAAAGADLVLGGHIHLPYVRPLNNEARKLASELWSVQAGTALSTRIREGISNSFHALHHDPRQDRSVCVVEQWDYDEAAKRFVAGARTSVPLARYASP